MLRICPNVYNSTFGTWKQVLWVTVLLVNCALNPEISKQDITCKWLKILQCFLPPSSVTIITPVSWSTMATAGFIFPLPMSSWTSWGQKEFQTKRWQSKWSCGRIKWNGFFFFFFFFETARNKSKEKENQIPFFLKLLDSCHYGLQHMKTENSPKMVENKPDTQSIWCLVFLCFFQSLTG